MRLLSETCWASCFCPHRAARAQNSGLFEQEIVPVNTKIVDDDGKERQVTVAKDDGIRAGTTLAGLAKLRPAFKPDGSTTAGESSAVPGQWPDQSQQALIGPSVSGNSSQVSDGAAAVLIGRRSAVEALGLPVLGVLRASAVVGVPPDVMGIGPAFAIPAALQQAGTMVEAVVMLLKEQSVDVMKKKILTGTNLLYFPLREARLFTDGEKFVLLSH